MNLIDNCTDVKPYVMRNDQSQKSLNRANNKF